MKKLMSLFLLLLGVATITNAQQLAVKDTVSIKNEKYIITGADKRNVFLKVQKIENGKLKTVHINKIDKNKEKNKSKKKLALGMSTSEVKSILKLPNRERNIEGTWGKYILLEYQSIVKKTVYLFFENDKLISIMQEK
ncbi:hypothetical protein EI427_01300 [Flammeovirga pectinis]|uniref:DUF2845 domain-containing protein n=1 Tax=Flammeovirga pectinis TaxID=2494373 RepID=A0A3Q9FKV6_9BACT|nr:hypothetical protein [Flammeovirga pectinis]AZQ60895.1 hypothetical protein EI427_01300 [Flammeovirga pectinis]